MPRRRLVNFNGQPADAQELGFRAAGEHWNEYLLDDGTVLRMKLVLTDVARVEGHYDAQGNPVYLAQSTNVLAVSAPDNLRRPGSEDEGLPGEEENP